MFIGTESYKKAIQVASAFAFAAALAFIANIVVATATEIQQVQLTAIGIDANPEGRVRPVPKTGFTIPRTRAAQHRNDEMVPAGQLAD